ncbi:Phage integrase family protein [Rhizobium freirei PRF 81]|uniref:Phage integrase family protein n=1 Tax=Rhizobium freirei PRF 81 TaxID=363754 RepID=N6VDI7_9HYPH|nr:site-specific integrase [Rhizobium freirei]ENN89107.1 Phage integrase family protein [Rhizobium freirei PRF 81]
MPQKRKPPRLYLRKDGKSNVWIIRDGTTDIRTGCSEGQAAEAERKLHQYLSEKYEPKRGGRAAEITIGDLILVYFDEKADATARPKETKAALGRLNEFFGKMVVADIRGKTCRSYVDHRGNTGGARRDLEVLRAAANYYHAEHTLDLLPKITLPEKSPPRERWLTRKEVADMIRAARNIKQCGHIVRLLLIGVYTGTRLSAMLGLQWMPNTSGGWVDLEKGVLHRKAQGERVAHNKRKTPMRIPPRLLTFLHYWKDADAKIDKERPTLNVINYYGAKVIKPHRAFRAVRTEAGLGIDVTPHTLRHTRATWLANAGIDVQEAASSLGITTEEFERTYLHNDPEFQQNAANAY